jgi:enterochelin esterase-like enzyme
MALSWKSDKKWYSMNNLDKAMKQLLFFIVLSMFFLFTGCVGNTSAEVLITDFTNLKGTYTHTIFKSKARENVDFNVYLPLLWSKTKSKSYLLIFLLYGQGESENKFLVPFSADSLNIWIEKQLIPEMVIVSLRGGKGTNKMQWYSDANETMITSQAAEELRKYCHDNFNTSIQSSQISLMGHSRGATGALNFVLHFPNDFASVVSGAFVSDYTVERL